MNKVVESLYNMAEDNRIILNEMSYDLDKAKKIVEDLAETFRIHWAFIFMLGRENDCYQHWLLEESTYCKTIDNIRVKTKTGKLKEDYIIDNLTWHIDTVDDAIVFVEYSWCIHNSKEDVLPSLDRFTEDDYNDFKDFMNELYDELPSLLCEKNNHSKEFYQNFIDAKVKKFGR